MPPALQGTAITQHPPGTATAAGLEGSDLPGPFAVGQYAEGLKKFLRGRPHVQLLGEVWNVHVGRGVKVYFELKDTQGAVRCSMWRNQFTALGLTAETLTDGCQVVLAGGLDYYPGSPTASPSFTFAVTDLRVAGEGDLLAQLARLRKVLDREGLFELQQQLPRPVLPRTIGVITSESGKARDDVLAGLKRRGWAGRLVWAFAPVQDRHAAPRIATALRDLAGTGEVDVIIVARGGGSLAELFAFCDETLCRTIALLSVPVITSIGHHTDRTLVDDVAAVSCSTPTHAAEAATPVNCDDARSSTFQAAQRLQLHSKRIRNVGETTAGLTRRLTVHARRAVTERAAALRHLSRAPAEHIARQRAALRQSAADIAASARRRLATERTVAVRDARTLNRRAQTAARDRHRAAGLRAIAMALDAHDPDQTLARGYALVTDRTGELVSTAAAAQDAVDLVLRFHDGTVPTTTGKNL